MIPRPLLRAAMRTGALVAGQPPTIEGQTLDREAHALVRLLARIERRASENRSPAEVRKEFDRTTPLLDSAPRAMARVIDTHAPGPAGPLPVRIFVPPGARDALLVFFHGGGGMLGSIATHEGVARRLAARARVTVASVEYRLAPEHPFPAAVDDALAAWQWAGTLGASRLGVGGDSFGGLLAATVAQRGPRPPDLALLIYPWLDLRLVTPSMTLFGEEFVLTRETLGWLRDAYAPDLAQRAAASPALAAPLRATSTILVTAGFDPLRDEGRDHADRLAAAGARVVYRCETDLVHGFTSMTGAIARAAIATDQLGDDLAAGLAR